MDIKSQMKKFLKKALVSPWTALITLALIVSVVLQGPGFIESVRLRYFDQLVTSGTPTENNIYTVNIDEETINKYGQWPFKRSVYANMIADLYHRNAGLVVWNVLMPEADRQGGDAALADTLHDYPVILMNMPSQADKNTPRKPGSAVIGSEFIDTIVNYPGVIANIPELENNASGIGIANTMEEIDGVNRRLPLFVGSNGNLFPSVPLEVLRVMSHDDTFQVKLNENGVEKMRIPSFRPITTDSVGRIWVDWRQKNQQVSAVKLPKDFKKGIVIDWNRIIHSIIIDAANKHDSKMLLPHLPKLTIHTQEKPLIMLADSAFDAQELYTKCYENNIFLFEIGRAHV